MSCYIFFYSISAKIKCGLGLGCLGVNFLFFNAQSLDDISFVGRGWKGGGRRLELEERGKSGNRF